MIERVWIGNTMRLSVEFSNEAGAPSPSAAEVTITAKRPDGVVVDGIVRPGPRPGAFHADFLADMAGNWSVRAACTGAVAVAEEERFSVAKSLVL